jgi:hypothetical protein
MKHPHPPLTLMHVPRNLVSNLPSPTPYDGTPEKYKAFLQECTRNDQHLLFRSKPSEISWTLDFTTLRTPYLVIPLFHPLMLRTLT